MACWSSHLMINLGLGTYIRYYRLESWSDLSSSLACTHSWSRSTLAYQPTDLLSSIVLSPQLILAINVELSGNRHIIDLFSLSPDTNELQRVERIDVNQPCPLAVITSLRDYTWLCKSYWPFDDCLCVIESDGKVTKLQLEEQKGYILNMRLVNDRSHLILVRTSSKLVKEPTLIDINEAKHDEVQQEQEQEQEHQQQLNPGQRRRNVGKLPSNLQMEIYRISGSSSSK
jgi:hypothetical protein